MVELTVGFGKQSTRVHLPAGATLQQLGDELAAAYGVAPATIKLMRIGGGGGGGGSMIKLQEQADQTLEEAGQGRGGLRAAWCSIWPLPAVAFLPLLGALPRPTCLYRWPCCRHCAWSPLQDAGQPPR